MSWGRLTFGFGLRLSEPTGCWIGVQELIPCVGGVAMEIGAPTKLLDERIGPHGSDMTLGGKFTAG